MTAIPAYALITHVVTVLGLLAVGKTRTFRKAALLLGVLAAAAIVSQLRLTDYEVYAEAFRNIDLRRRLADQTSPWGFEVGYAWITYTARYFTDEFNYVRLLLVFAALALKVALLWRWVEKASVVSLIFYVAIVFYPDSYLLRAALASSFTMLGVWVLMVGRPAYQFVLALAIASSIHLSALIALPIWFFREVDVSKVTGLLAVVGILLLGAVGIGHSSADLAANHLPSGLGIVSKLVMYRSSELFGGNVGLLRGSVLIYTAITVLFILLKRSISMRLPNYGLVLATMLYSMVLLAGLSDYVVLADRLFRILGFIFVVAFGQILLSIRKEERRLAALLVVVVLNVAPYFVTPYDIGLL